MNTNTKLILLFAQLAISMMLLSETKTKEPRKVTL